LAASTGAIVLNAGSGLDASAAGTRATCNQLTGRARSVAAPGRG
jgi:hypothetical protein